jgi:Tetratricopeptide repeat
MRHRGRLTADLGMAYHARGEEAAALAQLDAAIAIRRAPQDRRSEAIERNDLALVKSETGDPRAALDIYAQTRATFATLARRRIPWSHGAPGEEVGFAV